MEESPAYGKRKMEGRYGPADPQNWGYSTSYAVFFSENM